MAIPDFTMRQLLEAGVHFGRKAHRWNPKMGQYIFGTRNNIHIVDLAQTVPMLHRALQAVSDTVAKGGRILFVGTKRQAADGIAAAAKQSAQYYVNSRWLGGTLTNWKTISGSISRLRKLEEMLASGDTGVYSKHERMAMQRERNELDRSLGGIKDMDGLPDLIFVIDTKKEDIAIKEARRLNIPVAAIVDTNSDPAGITFPVPGSDDAARAVSLYCDLIARSALDGISRSMGERSVEFSAAHQQLVEEFLPTARELSDLGFEQLSHPRGVADDLKKLTGISSAVERQLNDLGIFHYIQLAELSPAAGRNIGEEVGLPGRVHGWVAKAREIVRNAELEKVTFRPSQRLIDIVHSGLVTHSEIVGSKGKELSRTEAISRERASNILTPRILEIIASKARRLRLGLGAHKPLLIENRFDYEFVVAIVENIPIRIDDATLFFNTLRDDLVSYLSDGGRIAGQWGQLVLRKEQIEFELDDFAPPNPLPRVAGHYSTSQTG